MHFVWEIQIRTKISYNTISWWRRQMETFSALLALCVGNSPVSAQRPVTRSFDGFFSCDQAALWMVFFLAKITILASMLVGHVCYLPKLPFWQVCWLVVFVCLSVCLFVCTVISQNLKNESANHHQTWSQASTSPWFLQVCWTRM